MTSRSRRNQTTHRLADSLIRVFRDVDPVPREVVAKELPTPATIVGEHSRFDVVGDLVGIVLRIEIGSHTNKGRRELAESRELSGFRQCASSSPSTSAGSGRSRSTIEPNNREFGTKIVEPVESSSTAVGWTSTTTP